MRYAKGAIAAAIAGSLAFANGHAEAGKKDDTLKVAFPKQLESLDAYTATAREAIVIARHIWDGLVYRDPTTGKYLGNLATSYKWIDSTTMEFELKKGVQFHNGETFDADDVVYTLNWVSNPDNGVKNQRNVNWIKNAEKTGDYSVTLRLKKPFPAALEYLAGPLVIYPNEYFAKVGMKGMGQAPVGTGPYKVTSVETGQRYILQKNEGYHNGPKGKPSIGKIIWRSMPERNTQYAELMSGGVDWIWQVPTDQANKMSSRFSVKSEASMRIGYIGFDASGRQGKNPMNDIRVRKAVAHAINRQGIVDALIKGSSTVVNSACFPTQFGCEQDVTKYEYAPEKAKTLLAEAGYPDGFTIPFYAYRDRDYAEAMVGDLKAVGINVDFKMLKYAALREKVQAGEVPLQFMTWGSYSVNDVSVIVSNFFKHGKDDYARDDDLKKWLDIADSSIDTNQRKENYSRALKKIANQVYWLPLWSYSTNYVYTKDLEFSTAPDEIPRFFAAQWK